MTTKRILNTIANCINSQLPVFDLNSFAMSRDGEIIMKNSTSATSILTIELLPNKPNMYRFRISKAAKNAPTKIRNFTIPFKSELNLFYKSDSLNYITAF